MGLACCAVQCSAWLGRGGRRSSLIFRLLLRLLSPPASRRLLDPDLGAVLQTHTADRSPPVRPGFTPLDDLHLIGLANTDFHFLLVRDANRDPPPSRSAPPSADGSSAAGGTTTAFSSVSATIATCTVAPGFSRSPGFAASNPDLHGGAVRIDRRADYDHLARYFLRAAGLG